MSEIVQKLTWVRLAMGADVHAKRVFPGRFVYTIRGPEANVALLHDREVANLVGCGFLVPPRVTQFTDDYTYRVDGLPVIQRNALRGFRYGCGECPVCHRVPVATDKAGILKKHGHHGIQPECAGTGTLARHFLPVTVTATAPPHLDLLSFL